MKELTSGGSWFTDHDSIDAPHGRQKLATWNISGSNGATWDSSFSLNKSKYLKKIVQFKF